MVVGTTGTDTSPQRNIKNVKRREPFRLATVKGQTKKSGSKIEYWKGKNVGAGVKP